MLHGAEGAGRRDNTEEVTVQVHWVVHHRVVDELDAHDLAAGDLDDRVLRQRPAVDAPNVALHVSRQPHGDRARAARLGFAGDLRWL